MRLAWWAGFGSPTTTVAGGCSVLIRATKTIETSEGRCQPGECVTLPPAEAARFVDAGVAAYATETIETASFVHQLPHGKRARRFRELSHADRLATDNSAN